MYKIFLIITLIFCQPAWALGEAIQPENSYPQVKLITSMGDIVVELERRRAPLTVNKFLHLTLNEQFLLWSIIATMKFMSIPKEHHESS